VGLPLLKYSLFVDAEAEPSRIQKTYICKDGLNPGFSDMSDQPDSIQFCHTISSITKSRFGY